MSRSTDDATLDDRPERAPGNSVVADVRFSLERWLRKTARNPFVTFTSLVQPAIFFVLMAEVFGAIAGSVLAQTVGSDVHYVTFLAPAIVIQSALAGAAVSGIGLVKDIDSGMFDKVLVAPMHHDAMLLGKVLAEVVRITVQTLIILSLGAVMLVVVSDASAGEFIATGVPGVLGVLTVVVLFGGVFISFSNIVAIVSRDEEATILIANLLTFPLLFVSSAFAPLAALPDWIQTLAVVNPITYGVDGVRAFLLGEDVLTVFDVTAFSGLWNTVVPVVGVLVVFNVVLGAIAVHLLNNASKAAVE